CAAEILREDHPDFTLVYLPHLDYDPQRFGPHSCDMNRLVRQLDDTCRPLLEAAQAIGARAWVISEYGHVPVSKPVLLNRVLRKAGLLAVRDGSFGENLDTFESSAFAVCDHQVAHVYVKQNSDVLKTRDILAAEPDVARVLVGEERAELHLNHERAGDMI